MPAKVPLQAQRACRRCLCGVIGSKLLKTFGPAAYCSRKGDRVGQMWWVRGKERHLKLGKKGKQGCPGGGEGLMGVCCYVLATFSSGCWYGGATLLPFYCQDVEQ